MSMQIPVLLVPDAMVENTQEFCAQVADVLNRHVAEFLGE